MTAENDTIYINANVLTSARSTVSIVDAAVACTDGKISWVGKMTELPRAAENFANEVVNCSGSWILPGFIDCHTHVIFAGDRSDEYRQRRDGKSYEQIAKEGG